MTEGRSFIPGIHFFCDHRCWRCPLTAHCRVHDRWSRSREPAKVRRQPAARVAMVAKAGVMATFEDIAEMAERHGMMLDAIPDDASRVTDDQIDARCRAAAESPLGVAATEYADACWHASRALRGPLAARRDADGLDACDRLEEMCSGIAGKIVRALTSAAAPEYDPADRQSDAHGAAKVALLLIEESRQAWQVLMRPGRSRGNGAPARFVAMLDRLEAEVLQRFPRAFEFVRPGFDTGEAAGVPAEIARAMLAAGAVRGTARH